MCPSSNQYNHDGSGIQKKLTVQATETSQFHGWNKLKIVLQFKPPVSMEQLRRKAPESNPEVAHFTILAGVFGPKEGGIMLTNPDDIRQDSIEHSRRS